MAIINGDASNNNLPGTADNDTISGFDGDDTLSGLAGNDDLFGGLGNDSLIGGTGDDFLRAGPGQLLNAAQRTSDTLEGGDGNDRLQIQRDTSSGVFDGGADDDLFEIEFLDGALVGTFDGGTGQDTLRIDNSANLVGSTFSGIETLTMLSTLRLSAADVASFGSVNLGTSSFRSVTVNIDGAGPAAFGDLTLIDDQRLTINADPAGNQVTFASITSPDTAELVFNGGALGESFTGSSGGDTLSGNDGNDTLSGLGGNDSLVGGAGDDELLGGEGNDSLRGGLGSDSLVGGDGNDDLIAGAGFFVSDPAQRASDTLQGGDGNDRLQILRDTSGGVFEGGADNDLFEIEFLDSPLVATLDGGTGQDLLRIDNVVNLVGSTITGFETTELRASITMSAADVGDLGAINLGTSTSRSVVITLDGAGPAAFGDITLIGTQRLTIVADAAGNQVTFASVSMPDTASLFFNGGALGETFSGQVGNDSLVGNDGNDTLIGLGGNDTLVGNTGDDELVGGDGNDSLRGERGDDSLVGGDGEDNLIAGTGAFVSDPTQRDSDTLQGGGGNDRLQIQRDTSGGLFEGGADNDLFEIEFLNDGAFTGTIDGGTGTDLLRIDNSANLIGATIQGIEDTELRGPIAINASDVGDLGSINLSTNVNRSVFINLSGSGPAAFGDVTLIGNQQLTINADPGGNQVTFASITMPDTAELIFNGGTLGESFTGQAGADTLTGGAGNDTLSGLGGNDSLTGNTGDDELLGGDGDDSLRGNQGDDSLVGGDGNDDLIAGTGGFIADPLLRTSDTLLGGDGNDRLLIQRDTSGGLFDGGADNDLFEIEFLNDGPFTGTIEGGTGTDLLRIDNVANLIGATIQGVEDTELRASIAINASDVGSLGAVNLSTNINRSVVINLNGSGPAAFGDVTLIGNQQLTINADPGGNQVTFASITMPDTAELIFNGGVAGESFTGQSGGDTLNGNDGNDTLIGLGGNDSLSGDAGDDELLGGDGDDSLRGDRGDDSLVGGDGNDDLIAGTGGFVADPLLRDTDTLQGGDGNDRLIIQRDTSGGLFEGGADNDQIEVGFLNDGPFAGTIDGGTGTDLLRIDNVANLSDATFSGIETTELRASLTIDAADAGDLGALNLGTNVNRSVTITVIGTDPVAFGDLTLIGNQRLTINADPAGNQVTFASITMPDTSELIFNGGALSETFTGANGDDTLRGNEGNDTLSGLAGDDSLVGNAGDDELLGGVGNDTLRGDRGDDSLVGGDGDDFLVAGNGGFVSDPLLRDTDTLQGGDGNDRLQILRDTSGGVFEGGADDDQFEIGFLDEPLNATLDGGSGEDTLRIDSSVDIRALGTLTSIETLNLIGNATIDGSQAAFFDTVTSTGTALSTLTVEGPTAPVFNMFDLDAGNRFALTINNTTTPVFNAVDVEAGSFFRLNAGSGNDVFSGFDSNDSLIGNAGDDTLLGLDGIDNLTGGSGDDSLLGGDGNDVLNGSNGNDTLIGGAGDDQLTDNDTNFGFSDFLSGGTGNDLIAGSISDGDVYLGGSGEDTIRIDGIAAGAVATIDGGANTDTLLLNTSNITGLTYNSIERIELGFARGTVAELNALLASQGVSVSGTFGQIQIEDGGAVLLPSLTLGSNAIFRITTSVAGNNVSFDGPGSAPTNVNGDRGGIQFLGNNGNDTFAGFVGDDSISGGGGDDSLSGGDGNDTFDSGAGTDTITTGDGQDIIFASDGDVITDFAAGDIIRTPRATFDSFVATTTATGTNLVIFQTGVLPSINITLDGFFAPIDSTQADPTTVFFEALPLVNLNGTPGDDNGVGAPPLSGTNEADTIDGLAGNDLIFGGAGNDDLSGGPGFDTIDAGTGDDTLSGGADGDELDGAAGNDEIDGDGGNDLIFTGTTAGAFSTDSDTARGGDGDDTIRVNEGTTGGLIDGGADDDLIVLETDVFTGTIDGGSGNDTLQVDAGTDLSNATLVGIETTILPNNLSISTAQLGIFGTFQSTGGTLALTLTDAAPVTLTIDPAATPRLALRSTDAGINATITETPGATNFVGTTFTGANGIDIVTTSDGADRINLGGGNDIASGGGGRDVIDGGAGNDTLNGDDGNDLISGRFGDDSILGGAGNDTIGGDDGDDYTDGGLGNDVIFVGLGNDVVFDQFGNNEVYGLPQGLAGEKDITLGDGDDIVSLVLGGTSNDTVRSGGGDDVVFTGGPVFGGDDLLILGSGDDLADAGTGNDTIFGGTGNDTLISLSGDNEVFGEQDNDVITVGTGADSVEGGSGNDIIRTQSSGTNGMDTLNGGSGNDTIISLFGDNVIDGGADDDEIEVGAGSDNVDGGSGNDQIFSNSNLGNDTINGGIGDDTIIVSGGGTFELTGGTGADKFWIEYGSTVTITDFNVSEGDEICFFGTPPPGGVVIGGNGSGGSTVTDGNGTVVDLPNIPPIDLPPFPPPGSPPDFPPDPPSDDDGGDGNGGGGNGTGGGGSGGGGGGSGGGGNNIPPPPPPKEADFYGDPHLTTLDGLSYSFQAVGEFALVRSIDLTNPDDPDNDLIPLDIHVRTAPVEGSDLVSIITQAAVRAGDQTVVFDPLGSTKILVDGVPTDVDGLDAPLDLDDGSQIFVQGEKITLVLSSGEQVQVGFFDGRIDVCVFVDTVRGGRIEGLLGNADDDPMNDLALSQALGGRVFDLPISFDDLYGPFADSYRLTDAESLLHYEPGETTSDFQRFDFPVTEIDVDDLPPQVLLAAQAAAAEAGIDDPSIFLNAVLDIALTGDTDFAAGAAGLAAVPIAETNVDESTVPEVDAIYSVANLDSELREDEDGGASFEFVVFRMGDDGAVDVDYQINFGTASADDFVSGTAFNGTISFEEGQMETSVVVQASADGDIEGDETFSFSFTAPVDALVSSSIAQAVILEDDAAFSATVVSDVFEGTGTDTEIEFLVTRTGDTSQAGSVDFSFSGNTDAADFVSSLPSGTLEFAAGVTSRTVTVTVAGDSDIEADELLSLTLTNPVGAVLAQDTATVEILNDDAVVLPPEISISAVPIDADESVLAASDISFELTRTGDLNQVSQVDVSFGGDIDASDVAAGELNVRTIQFAAGESQKTVTLDLLDDTDVEPDEQVTLTLSNAVNSTVGTSNASVLVLNDDMIADDPFVPPVISISGAPGPENEADFAGSGVAFALSRTGDTTVASTVDVTFGGDIDASDVAAGELNTRSIQFAIGETQKTVVLNLLDDAVVEPDEQVTLTLSNPSSATLGTSLSSTTVLNDDIILPEISVSGPEDATEGDFAASGLIFTLTRSGDTSVASQVDVSFGGALNASDLASGDLSNQIVNFAIGETQKTITLDIADDSDVEPDELVSLTLSNPTNATLGTSSSSSTTVLNDDEEFIPPEISVSGPEDATEGDFAASGLTFTLTRSGDTSVASQVDVSFGGALNASDLASGDLSNRTIDFAIGETQKTITLDIADDSDVEPDELVSLTLSNPTNATLGTSSASTTVLNDDEEFIPPEISVSNAPADAEESAFASSGITFTLTRTGDLSQASQVEIAFGGALSASDLASGDLSNQTVDFAIGETQKTITLDIADDSDVEPDELVSLTLSNPTNATLGTSSASTTVLNDDEEFIPPEISVSGPEEATEGDFAASGLTFTLTRSGDTSVASQVDVSFGGALGASDLASGDLSNQTIDFAIGETQKTITLDIADDSDVEPDELVSLTLSNPTNATLGTSNSASTTVLNDDELDDPVINVIEGTPGRDILRGTADADQFIFNGGIGDVAIGAGGDDIFDFSENTTNGSRDVTRIIDWSDGDTIAGFVFEDVNLETVRSTNQVLRFAYGPDQDIVTITGEVSGGVSSLFDVPFT